MQNGERQNKLAGCQGGYISLKGKGGRPRRYKLDPKAQKKETPSMYATHGDVQSRR